MAKFPQENRDFMIRAAIRPVIKRDASFSLCSQGATWPRRMVFLTLVRNALRSDTMGHFGSSIFAFS